MCLVKYQLAYLHKGRLDHCNHELATSNISFIYLLLARAQVGPAYTSMAEREWSSRGIVIIFFVVPKLIHSIGPIRMLESTSAHLTSIPIEIYLEIFDHLRGFELEFWMKSATRRKVFWRLALVCHFFHSAVRPWIFETITFPGATSRALMLCRKILEKEPNALLLAKHVKRCVFHNWYCGNSRLKATGQPMSDCHDAMVFMPNLHEIHLEKRSLRQFSYIPSQRSSRSGNCL